MTRSITPEAITAEERIVARCDALVKASGLAAATISGKVFQDSERLDQLRTGQSWLRPPTMPGVLARLAELEERFPPETAAPQPEKPESD